MVLFHFVYFIQICCVWMKSSIPTFYSLARSFSRPINKWDGIGCYFKCTLLLKYGYWTYIKSAVGDVFSINSTCVCVKKKKKKKEKKCVCVCYYFVFSLKNTFRFWGGCTDVHLHPMLNACGFIPEYQFPKLEIDNQTFFVCVND